MPSSGVSETLTPDVAASVLVARLGNRLVRAIDQMIASNAYVYIRTTAANSISDVPNDSMRAVRCGPDEMPEINRAAQESQRTNFDWTVYEHGPIAEVLQRLLAEQPPFNGRNAALAGLLNLIEGYHGLEFDPVKGRLGIRSSYPNSDELFDAFRDSVGGAICNYLKYHYGLIGTKDNTEVLESLTKVSEREVEIMRSAHHLVNRIGSAFKDGLATLIGQDPEVIVYTNPADHDGSLSDGSVTIVAGGREDLERTSQMIAASKFEQLGKWERTLVFRGKLSGLLQALADGNTDLSMSDVTHTALALSGLVGAASGGILGQPESQRVLSLIGGASYPELSDEYERFSEAVADGLLGVIREVRASH